MNNVIKSVHIKEFWPYQYVAPTRRLTKEETRIKDNARKREAYKRKKLLVLPVYEMNIDFCDELNGAKG